MSNDDLTLDVEKLREIQEKYLQVRDAAQRMAETTKKGDSL